MQGTVRAKVSLVITHEGDEDQEATNDQVLDQLTADLDGSIMAVNQTSYMISVEEVEEA